MSEEGETAETGLLIEKGGVRMQFFKDSTTIWFDHLPETRYLWTGECGEAAIQWLIQAAISLSKTAEELEGCMKRIRVFYAEYLIDKSALNTLAFRLRNNETQKDKKDE